MGDDLEVKVLWMKLVAGNPSKPQGEEAREGPAARPALKAVGSETVGRRTGIGYEAQQPRESEQRFANPCD